MLMVALLVAFFASKPQNSQTSLLMQNVEALAQEEGSWREGKYVSFFIEKAYKYIEPIGKWGWVEIHHDCCRDTNNLNSACRNYIDCP